MLTEPKIVTLTVPKDKNGNYVIYINNLPEEWIYKFKKLNAN